MVTFLCEKTGAVALAQLDIMAGRQASMLAGWQASNQADEMLLHLEIFKIIYRTKHWKFINIQKRTV